MQHVPWLTVCSHLHSKLKGLVCPLCMRWPTATCATKCKKLLHATLATHSPLLTMHGCMDRTPPVLPFCLQMCQRAVYGKKGTDITKLVPHSSMLYIEGVNEKKA